MPKAREIKKRIRGIENIQEITRAMKLVAAARIKKAEEAVLSCMPYTEKVKEIMKVILEKFGDGLSHELMTERDVKRVAIVPVSGDKGLCGSFNSNILRLSNHIIEIMNDKEILLIPVGNKAYRYYIDKNFNIPFYYFPLNDIDYSLCRDMTQRFIKMFLDREVDEIYFIYGKFISTMSQKIRSFRFLPFNQEENTEENKDNREFIIEPSQGEFLDYLIPKYLEVLIYQIILDSVASELGARLMAMTNATDNAEDLIGDLKLRFYRARQEAITTQIIEVTSGAESIKH
ncbi:MAG TPA: ATP synthase F1 subunit gamma [Candidatus Eremiobacteraeota bacterium]|nr:MAG: ATP synthase gamma chain [bacterium ADurb.Bin363]HPZ08346.1 ATP synthase F1 subunit gamma [Candidatus Eremiobacteraeota bacterium]